ncbi:MAG: sensor histidine kinase [Leptolyngbyaceae cyanobacterium]
MNPQEVFDPKRAMIMSWVESVFIYITAITFVLVLCFTILSEHKAQRRAQKLVEEIETLSTMLERERIARNIHDTLGHTLTTLNIQLEVAQQIGESNISQTLQRVKTAKHLADQCLHDVRQTVQTMREDNFDLAQALRALMDQMQHTQSLKKQPIRSQVALNLPPLPLQTSYQLYQIVQEGVTNIQKHAEATQTQLKGWATTNTVHVELSDNGQGFDFTQLSQGYGLKGIQERVQLIGGTLQIQTTLGQGTKLLIQIPLAATSVLIPLVPEVSQ